MYLLVRAEVSCGPVVVVLLQRSHVAVACALKLAGGESAALGAEHFAVDRLKRRAYVACFSHADGREGLHGVREQIVVDTGLSHGKRSGGVAHHLVETVVEHGVDH